MHRELRACSALPLGGPAQAVWPEQPRHPDRECAAAPLERLVLRELREL